MPCKKNFINNDIIPKEKCVAITYGVKDYYYEFTNNVIGMDKFGISAKKEDVLNYFGYNVEEISDKIRKMFGSSEEEN